MFGKAPKESAVRLALLILIFFAFPEPVLAGGYVQGEEVRSRGKGLEKRSAYEVIIKKNLFDHTRRFTPQKKREAVDISSRGIKRLANVGNMVLEGIVVFNNRRVAVIREGKSSKGRVKEVEAGDLLGTYKVVRIEDEALLLIGPRGSKHLLTLFNMDTPVKRKHINSGRRGGYAVSTP